MTDLKDIHLDDRIPNNLLKDEKVRNTSEVITPHLRRLAGRAPLLSIETNLEKQPEDVLDHLLWEKHIGESEGLRLVKSKEEKIQLIKAAIELHKTKGTPYAIEKSLQTVNLKGIVEEWFEYEGNPYCFMVELSINNKLDQLDDIKKLIMEYKNKRSWFDGFVIAVMYDNVYLIFADNSYTYPVFYKVTGTFVGEKGISNIKATELSVYDDSYNYIVEYPITKTETTNMRLPDSEIGNRSYYYAKELKVAGEFYCGGEW